MPRQLFLRNPVVPDWRPFSTAPKDGRPIVVLGLYKQREGIKGRELCIVHVRWSTFMSDGTGHDWIVEGALGTLNRYTADFLYWTEIPLPLIPSDMHAALSGQGPKD